MTKENITGLQKCAILMLALEQNTVAKLLSKLEDDEIKDITYTMSNLGNISHNSIESLITEFNNEISSTQNFVGNIQNTERLLRKVLNDEKVDIILEEIRGPAGKNIWDKLSNVSEEILANYIKNEYPQTAALILSKIPSSQAAAVLKLLNQEFAFEIIKRMLVMDPVKKEVLEGVERTLRNEFITGLSKTHKYDTTQVMAEIFNSFDRSTEQKYMEMLEKYNNDTAENIKRLMFTFNDFLKIDSAGMQAIMKVVDKARLPVALKGASEEIRKKFIDNMSQRAAKILQDEIESLGPVKIKDVDEAQSAIIVTAKDLINSGEIELSDGSDDDQLIY